MKLQSFLFALLLIDLIDVATVIVYAYVFLAGFCGRTFYRLNKSHVNRAWVLWFASILAGATWPFGMRVYYILARSDLARLFGKFKKRRFVLPSRSQLSKEVE